MCFLNFFYSLNDALCAYSTADNLGISFICSNKLITHAKHLDFRYIRSGRYCCFKNRRTKSACREMIFDSNYTISAR